MSSKSPYTTKIGRGAYSAIIFIDGDLIVVEDNVGTIIKEDTDAATSLQAAVDGTSNGARIFIDAAKYTISSAIDLDHSLALIGGGLAKFNAASATPGLEAYTPLGGAQLWLANSSNCDMLKVKSSGVNIENLVLDGNRANQTAGNLIHTESASPEYIETNVKSCQILNAKEAGILYESWRGTITGSFIADCDVGIEMSLSSHLHFHTYSTGLAHNRIGIYSPLTTTGQCHWRCIGNGISYNGEEGINYGGYSPLIANSNFYRNGGDGIYLSTPWDAVSMPRILGNNIERNQNGIKVRSLAMIEGNDIYENYKNGILGEGKDIKVLGNTIIYNDVNNTNTYDGVKLTYSSFGRNYVALNFITGNDRYNVYSANVPNYIMHNYIGADGISVAGSNVIVKGNYGYVTENNVLSSTFAIDSTGVKTVTIAHGLAITPAKEDCHLTVIEETNVDDWGFDLLKVDSVDATNVTAKIHVSTASATGSATAKLALRVGKL